MSRGARHVHFWTWSRRLCAGAFLALLFLGRFDWFPWFKGSTSATQALGVVPFVDPLAALEVTLATRTLIPTVWIGAASLLLIAVLFGPVFCGWICPLGLILDLGHSLRKRVDRSLAKRRLQLPEWQIPRATKFGVLTLVLGFSLTAQVPLFQVLSPINLVSRAVAFTVDFALLAVLAILVVEFFAPRTWCRSLCPLGALYTTLGRAARLRIRVAPDRAGEIRCRRCDVGCPLGIAVMEDYTLAGKPSVDHPDCTRCGTCVDVCPNSVLGLGFRDREATPPDLVPTTSADGTRPSRAASPGKRVKLTR